MREKGAWGVSSDHENVVQKPGFVASARDLGQTLGAAGFWVGWVGCFLDIFGGLDRLWDLCLNIIYIEMYG